MKLMFFVLAALCGLIATRLLLFRAHGAKHRPGAARMAYVLAVLCGTVTISVAYGRYEWALVALIGIVAILCLGTFFAHGNVANLFHIPPQDNAHDNTEAR